ncbi:AAA family ATPase [Flagellatimonas centrodinii]|uniref:ParA family protein n=1 Tax=Flagellatimonas centrodinii TaxID=2806210 RepID=UPI001FEEA086|nr:AAA family ATPase [Flagellatimonas centrodinii]ULQ47870.1 AAA family ATPase [Flagellatimonas centrodinii]
MKTLALYQLKGGVGKTSSAVNLAAFAAAQGYQTLLWDLDPQGAATWYFEGRADEDIAPKRWLNGQTPIGRLVQRTGYDRLDLLPATLSNRFLDVLLRKVEPPRQALSRLLKPFSEHYQLVVLDAPPGLSHLADNIMEAADLVLMPVVPGFLSSRAADQVLHYAAAEGLPKKRLLGFHSLVDRRRTLHRQQADEGAEAATLPFSAVSVPYASSVERMGEHRAPLSAFAPTDDPALQAYAELWLDVKRRLSL